MDARDIIETAKSVGQAVIRPGYKLFTRECFRKGRIVDLDDTHRVEVARDGIFDAAFIFVAAATLSERILFIKGGTKNVC